MKTAEERFWPKVNKQTPTGCWQWLGGKTKGYGQFYLGGRVEKAHRACLIILGKQLNPFLTIDHLCRNKACVNPKHLEEVTIRMNILRTDNNAAVNARKTHCKWGHEFTKENTYIVIQKDRKNPGRQCRICRDRCHKQWMINHPKIMTR